MQRETKEIKLNNCIIKVITFLTWGEKEEIETIITNGANVTTTGMSGYDAGAILEAKYRLLEIGVKEIIIGEETKSFTRDWMNNLAVEDGDILYNALDELVNKKKQK